MSRARSTKRQVAGQLQRLLTFHGRENEPQVVVDEYVAGLVEFPEPALRAAVSLAIRTMPWLPKLSELRDLVVQALPDASIENLAKTVRREVSEGVGFRRRYGEPEMSFRKLLRLHRDQCEANLADDPGGPWEARITAIDLILEEESARPAPQARQESLA